MRKLAAEPVARGAPAVQAVQVVALREAPGLVRQGRPEQVRLEQVRLEQGRLEQGRRERGRRELAASAKTVRRAV